MAVYTNDLRLKEIATGDESGTWGTSTNTNLSLIAEAFSFGTEAITTNADTHTTTLADGSTDPGRSIFLKYTGTLDSACTITIGPNTVSKLWLIENATSGSQNIIIKQGSGATVTIANGQTKAIYSDGAGSGGAMVDAFQDLSIPDLFVDDDLTIGDDLVFSSDSAVITFGADGDTTLTHTDGSGLTLNSTNKLMFNDASQFIQGSSATVLSLGATDEIDLTATLIDINGNADVSGTVTATGTSVFASLDISGDIDVDGTTNLDVVDIDGAVDMASTLTVGGNVTINSTTLKVSGDFPQLLFEDTAGSDVDAYIVNNANGLFIGKTNSPSASNDIVSIDLSTGGVVFNEASNDADFRIESNGNTHMLFVDGGNDRVGIGMSPSTDLHIKGTTSFDGDGSSRTEITSATASSIVSLNVGGIDATPSLARDVRFFTNAASSGKTERMRIDSVGNVGIGATSSLDNKLEVVGNMRLRGVTNPSFKLNNNDVETVALELNSGASGTVALRDNIIQIASDAVVVNELSADVDFRVESNDNASMLVVDAGSNQVGIGANPTNSALYVGKGGGFAGQLLVEGGSGSTYVGIGHGTDNPALHWQTGDFRFATSTASDLTGFSEKMRIMSTGKVLIGDTASHTTDLLQIETPASGGGHGIQIRRNDSNSDQGVGRVMFGNNTDTELASVSAKTDGATDSGALLFNTSATGGSLTERFRISSTGSLTMNGAAGTSPIFELINNDNEDISTGRETSIRFSGHRSGGEDVVNAQIGGHHFGSADDDRGMILMYTNAGSATLAERLRLTPDDAVFNEGSADTDFRVESDANANGLFLDASTGHASVGVTAATTTYGGTFRLLQIGNGAGYGIFNGLTSATANDAGVASFFGQTSGTSGYDVVGGMRIALAADSSSNSEGKIEFYTATGGNLVEAMEITNSQQLILHGVKDDTTSDAANMNIRSSDGLVRRSTSSRRYKNTITDATHGLTELLKLRSVTYKGNNDGDRLFGGLIAEEVHDAGLTEFVQYNSDDEPDALAYGHMISLCIKAIQEQQALIETLQAEVAALKGG